MRFVGVLEAKTQLSKLLEEIERTGEPVMITRHGKPVATIYGAETVEAVSGVAEGDSRGVFEEEPRADVISARRAYLREAMMGKFPAVRPNAGKRRLSGQELVVLFERLRASQPSDPEMDAMTWEELKELGRS